MADARFYGPCDFTTSGICRYALGNPCSKCPFKGAPEMSGEQLKHCVNIVKATAFRRNETLRDGWENRLAKHAWPGSGERLIDYIEYFYYSEIPNA